ncbi:hypothetical protein CTZ28_02715 [Streptomyces shenzhenensis]|uniref:Uncharacterized protein n=1 Tax=Streptomyces shenzhenensis TaxID=943815 RepID=A0A3M0IGJ2_9ACTN|nr:hypothetical protein CTZ28_02715 [Streptomyces shenzhenensis]
MGAGDVDGDSSANAAGADSRASGAMTAVAAAAAMARRRFMKTSWSPGAAAGSTLWPAGSACGARGVSLGRAGVAGFW